VIRIGVLLVLFVVGRANAQGLTVGGLDQDRLTAVYSEALGFIAPRIVEPVSVPRLAVWGLQGLTALDPDLRIVATDSRLKLLRQTEIVLDVAAPKDENPASWGKVATALTAASLPVSAAVRRAGTQGVIQNFFGQMFSQIDSYSRYVPPVEATEERVKRAGRAGLGMTVGQRGVLIEVKSVVRDSPAAIAGIRPGDILASIDGQRTQTQAATNEKARPTRKSGRSARERSARSFHRL